METSPTSEVEIGRPVEKGHWANSHFIYNGQGLFPFACNFDIAKTYCDVINLYQSTFKDKIKIYCMIIPTLIEFSLPDAYQSITDAQKPNIDYIYDHLSSDIITIDAYSKLHEHSNEYLYFNTDHHWTALGAYYAYTAFAERAGFDPLVLENCEVRTLQPFLGTIYSQTRDPVLLDNADKVDYYIIPGEYKVNRFINNEPFTAYPSSLYGEYAANENSYSVFLHGDFPMIRIDTQNNNGRRLLVSKESFGNAFVPFLIPHFEQIFVVDERYVQQGISRLVTENNINEILFINNIFAANTPIHINSMKRMMSDRFVNCY